MEKERVVESASVKEEQQKLWNAPACAWVEAQELLDQLFKPFEELLTDAVAADRATAVLDVGCGTGATTLAAARRLGAGSRCVGIDISGPMIEFARARAQREGSSAEFIQADAEDFPFEASSFDAIISRFGVMFFADSVRAFANLRRATKPGGTLRFIAWRDCSENPFMTAAERAAAPLLPNIPPRRSEGPGQFAFADRERVQRILQQSGWTDIDISPIDVPCAFPERALSRYMTRFGPLGQVLQEADEPTRKRVVEAVRAAYEPYVHGPEVRFTAACWLAAANSGDKRV
jgi:ubiquinone/menaquinone biosynthesis C-methylase UbiE